MTEQKGLGLVCLAVCFVFVDQGYHVQAQSKWDFLASFSMCVCVCVCVCAQAQS